MTGNDAASTANSGGLLQGCGVVLLVVGGFLVLIVGYAYLQLQAQYRAPEAVPVDATWQRTRVHLPADESARGHLTITTRAALGTTRVALTAGVPEVDPLASAQPTGQAPADLLRMPVVRLSVVASPGSTVACVAPCELDIGGYLPPCADDPCTRALEIRVEQLDPPAGSVDGGLAVELAGGATAPLRQRLPDGLAVGLAMDPGAP